MKMMNIVIVNLFLFLSLIAQAGIGDIVGGSSSERQRFNRILKNSSTHIDGDIIHFQEQSIWVSASLNNSLCFDGSNYQAIVALCVEYGSENECLQTQRTRVFQPEISTRIRCVKTSELGCDDYEEVLFRQNLIRNITLREDHSHGNILARGRVRIRSCQ